MTELYSRIRRFACHIEHEQRGPDSGSNSHRTTETVLPMKTTSPSTAKTEDKTTFQKEMDATKTIHDALLSVAPARRGPLIGAIAILLQIHIPRD